MIRAIKDRLARQGIVIGGLTVIAAVMLIFFYLLYAVIPLFESAEIKQESSYVSPGKGKTLFVGVEELGEMAVRFTDQGEVVFFVTMESSFNGFRRIKLLVCVVELSFLQAKLPVWCLFLGQTNNFMRPTVILLCLFQS